MNVPIRLSVLLFLAVLGMRARAELSLAPLFSEHAVLQCDQVVPVWGRAAPAAEVTVTFGGQSVSATADADGIWILCLPPQPASAAPAELIVAAGRERLTVHDVVVGEVWLASGQSNMEMPVSRLADDEQKIAATDLPLVRQVKIERAVARTPADTVATGGWQPAAPATVGDFSAVAYFFARELQRKLGEPVGIINSTWGGTEIEAWMSARARASTSLAAALDARWQHALAEWPPERVARYAAEAGAWQKADEEAHAAHRKNPLPWPPPPATPDSPRAPGGLFNGMIAPLSPFAIRGIIWYQGESNTGRAAEYAELFAAMIHSWRETWGQGGPPAPPRGPLPFYFVQLPAFATADPRARDWAQLREAQAKALALPATGMAVAIDNPEPEDIHPTRKQELGRRLALLARAHIYGVQVDASGPLFASAAREGAAMRVHFTHAGNGLVAHDRPVQALELAGADRVFHPATARIAGDTLLVSSPDVKEPVAVRYAFTNAPAANLYNGAGLPAAPFRSDDW
ncbi:MAG TPA: sialate O-acetylesterase [Opitutus sp.]|nr:sialate O-acetylesterase [Opitutus sp.]